MDEIERAMLGDQEAAKRLTDAGVLVPCCCGDDAHIKYDEKPRIQGLLWKPYLRE